MATDPTAVAAWEQAGAARHTAEEALAAANRQAVVLVRLEEHQTAGFDALHAEIRTLAMNVESGISGMNRRLDTLNGETRTNTDWRFTHDKAHAHADGFVRGSTNIRRRDWAIFGGMLTAAGAISGIVFKIIEAVS